MSLDAHRLAVLALMRAPGALPSTMPVYSELVPNGTSPPYIRVSMRVSYPEVTDLRHRSNRALLRIVVHSVGQTEDAADAVAQAVRGVLLDVVPTVSGRACFPIRHESSANIRPDEYTGEFVADALDVYRLESLPG